MKRLVKAVLKSLWRGTQPLRQPFLRRFEAYLKRCLQPAEQLMADETNALMEQVVRELVRMERRVEYLQQIVEERMPAREDVAIAGEIAPSEQLKAG